MLNDESLKSFWEEEKKYLAAQKEASPDLFVRQNSPAVPEQLARIGIVVPGSADFPSGAIKTVAQDFLVEEILTTGEVVNIQDQEHFAVSETSAPFVSATLTKLGISTIDAVKEIARHLGIKETQIGYGGVKDAVALTAQRITLPTKTIPRLRDFPVTNFYLSITGSAASSMGINQNAGNRFTILLRNLENNNASQVQSRLQEIGTTGFWNFYWTQRFGVRLLSHWWGLCLLQGKEKKALRSYLCDPGPVDLPFFINLRQKASENFENWDEMIRLFEPLKFTMRNELALLNYLKEYKKDYVGAFRVIPEQAKMWIYAYSSYLFNKTLSLAAAGQSEVGSSLPLLLTRNPAERAIYEGFLQQDQVSASFEQNIRRLDFVRLASRRVETKIFPKNIQVKEIPEGIALMFDLPRGAYATTFLSHMFNLTQAPPLSLPPAVDLKQVFGMGSIEVINNKLQTGAKSDSSSSAEAE